MSRTQQNSHLLEISNLCSDECDSNKSVHFALKMFSSRLSGTTEVHAKEAEGPFMIKEFAARWKEVCKRLVLLGLDTWRVSHLELFEQRSTCLGRSMCSGTSFHVASQKGRHENDMVTSDNVRFQPLFSTCKTK